jgi:sec-independent protein translocase protein TatB
MSSGIGFSELIILALIGLIVLGPERLPRVASQIGSWLGQAKRMTRVMRRQLEDELDFDENLNPKQNTPSAAQRDDDTYSPMHVEESVALSESAEALAETTRTAKTTATTTDENAEGEEPDEEESKTETSAGEAPQETSK